MQLLGDWIIFVLGGALILGAVVTLYFGWQLWRVAQRTGR